MLCTNIFLWLCVKLALLYSNGHGKGTIVGIFAYGEFFILLLSSADFLKKKSRTLSECQTD